MSFWVPKKGQLSFSKGFREMDKKALIHSKVLKFPLEYPHFFFLVQPKINRQSFKSTPDSLKQRLKAFERRRSLGVPEICLDKVNVSGLALLQ